MVYLTHRPTCVQTPSFLNHYPNNYCPIITLASNTCNLQPGLFPKTTRPGGKFAKSKKHAEFQRMRVLLLRLIFTQIYSPQRRLLYRVVYTRVWPKKW
jgi:hypothetical protein